MLVLRAVLDNHKVVPLESPTTKDPGSINSTAPR